MEIEKIRGKNLFLVFELRGLSMEENYFSAFVGLVVVYIFIRLLFLCSDCFWPIKHKVDPELILRAKDWLRHLEIGTPIDKWTPPLDLVPAFKSRLVRTNILGNVDQYTCFSLRGHTGEYYFTVRDGVVTTKYAEIHRQ
jgi:hypothetical protein